jgi:hypothetical protein
MLLTGEKRVAEHLVYSPFFDTHAGEWSAKGVDGLLAALPDKRPTDNMHVATKTQVSDHSKQPPTRGGNPSQGNKGDTTVGKTRTRGRH